MGYLRGAFWRSLHALITMVGVVDALDGNTEIHVIFSILMALALNQGQDGNRSGTWAWAWTWKMGGVKWVG